MNEKYMVKKCEVCSSPVYAGAYNNGRCEFCGWVQGNGFEDPNKIYWSYNFVSLNKAKQLVEESRAIKPDFGDFLECMKVYGELEFYFKGKQYGVLGNGEGIIAFYQWNVMDKGYQEYASIEEFARYANINGTLLREIWDSVENVGVAS